jgi:hypothetical protein
LEREHDRTQADTTPERARDAWALFTWRNVTTTAPFVQKIAPRFSEFRDDLLLKTIKGICYCSRYFEFTSERSVKSDVSDPIRVGLLRSSPRRDPANSGERSTLRGKDNK